MATSYGPVEIAAVIVVIGVLTYLCRLSFIALFGRLSNIPPRVERVLRFVPAAVLAALVLPSFVSVDPGSLAVDKLLAGAVATGVAWRTEDVFATILTGMGVLWAVRFLV